MDLNNSLAKKNQSKRGRSSPKNIKIIYICTITFLCIYITEKSDSKRLHRSILFIHIYSIYTQQRRRNKSLDISATAAVG